MTEKAAYYIEAGSAAYPWEVRAAPGELVAACQSEAMATLVLSALNVVARAKAIAARAQPTYYVPGDCTCDEIYEADKGRWTIARVHPDCPKHGTRQVTPEPDDAATALLPKGVQEVTE